MAEPLLNIRQAMQTVTRGPISNTENIGETFSSGPANPNESVKKYGENKRSFLSNTGTVLQSTPVQQAFTPQAVNVGSLIYTDELSCDKDMTFFELEFTKPYCKYDNYDKDLLDFLPMIEPQLVQYETPPNTPPPAIKNYSFDLDCSYQDDFFTDDDDFTFESIPEEELGLPDIF